MESYVLDYPSRGESATRKYEILEEQYAADAPNLNHLVCKEDGRALWAMRGIAVVLGRSPSSVTRTFQKMRDNTAFQTRAEALAVTSENQGHGARPERRASLVSIQVFFKDGTKSNLRIYENAKTRF